jgi:bacterioferritin
MDDLAQPKTNALLNRVMQAELAGVVRYTSYALIIVGPNRLPLVDFMKAQATESLAHALQVGELLTGLDGIPSVTIQDIDGPAPSSVADVLQASLDHEQGALTIYKQLLAEVEGKSVYLEEFSRSQIAAEELHVMEIRKLLRDYTPGAEHSLGVMHEPPG